MSTTTQERLTNYLRAEAQILGGQEVWMDGQRLRRADLAEIRKAITDLELKLAREQRAASGSRSTFAPAVASFNGCD